MKNLIIGIIIGFIIGAGSAYAVNRTLNGRGISGSYWVPLNIDASGNLKVVAS